ncbi:RNA polymerase sigma factor [Chitinophaga lutea]
MPSDNLDIEKELLARIADGDQTAFKGIYDKYWDRIYYNALKFVKSPELAQDLAQEIFERIWIKREGLKTVERFDAYLFTVAKHMIYNELQRQFIPGKLNEFLYTYLEDNTTSAFQQLELKELQQHVNDAIDSLPPQLRTVFTLSRFEGLTHAQIAVRMNISKVSSQAYVVRALLAIRKYLKEKGVYLAALIVFGKIF